MYISSLGTLLLRNFARPLGPWLACGLWLAFATFCGFWLAFATFCGFWLTCGSRWLSFCFSVGRIPRSRNAFIAFVNFLSMNVQTEWKVLCGLLQSARLTFFGGPEAPDGASVTNPQRRFETLPTGDARLSGSRFLDLMKIKIL